MNDIFKLSGELRLDAFDPWLLERTADLDAILAAAADTRSSLVDSTHILIALSRISNGFTQGFFLARELSPSELESGLLAAASSAHASISPKRLTVEALHPTALAVFRELESRAREDPSTRLQERQLLAATLKHLAPSVADLFERFARLQVDQLVAAIDVEVKPLDPFSRNAYSWGASRVIDLMRAEAEGLGYEEIDPRHILIGLLEHDGGPMQMIVLQQDLSPKRVQERVMLNLRSRASRQRTSLELSRAVTSPSAVQILETAARYAAADACDRIYEVHLLRAFLEIPSFARQMLEDAELDLSRAAQSARQHRPDDEPKAPVSGEARTWEKITAELQAALVGQDDVVSLCLPYIRRAMFGFKRQGKPAAVFLFCGPSGVGKTEMAKAMARAVFGSEDNLIMLEMGQFQTKESMNIFVGAPPGYVGYGEGKLTNGLRDKPRAVVLFDEVEKAHAEVFDALLRFIDEGRIDDPAGPVRDGTDCIIVMTSNVRTDSLQALVQRGEYRKNKWEIRKHLREALLSLEVSHGSGGGRDPFRFRVEFLNRVDEIVLFRNLDELDMMQIALRHLEQYRRRLAEEMQIDIAYSPSTSGAAWLIGRFCASLSEGARTILRLTQAKVLDPVIDFLYVEHCEPPVSLVVHLLADPRTVEEPQSVVGFDDLRPQSTQAVSL